MFKKLFPNLKSVSLIMLLVVCPTHIAVSQQANDVASAEQSFKFIAITLQGFRRAIGIDNEIGVNASDYEGFAALLEQHYLDFTDGFRPDSNFCNFYHDPDNAIMEIEQRAALAFQYLPELQGRLERYVNLDRQFKLQLRINFGQTVLENIQRLKPDAVTFEYLPIYEMDGSQTVNFADTACR